MKNKLFLLLSIILLSCSEQEKTSQAIINEAIAFHGGASYDTLDVSFKFRERSYEIHQDRGSYKYKRIFIDSLENIILDVLTNQGLVRTFNDSTVELSSKDSAAYANSVNSVQYFAILPEPLSDGAVISSRKKDITIKDKDYYSIEVRFTPENGGEDHDDVFLYWFDQDDYSMDYLAYRYNTEGGGIRFREAYNPREIEGVLFQDYNNFKAELGTSLEKLPELFEKGELELLSKIELEF